MKNLIVYSLSLFTFSFIYANTTHSINEKLIWTENEVQLHPNDAYKTKIYSFNHSVFNSAHPEIPAYANRIRLDGYGDVEFDIKVIKSSPIQISNESKAFIQNLEIQKEISQEKNSFYASFSFIPIINAGGQFEKIEEFEIIIKYIPKSKIINRGPEPTYESALSDGDIYKLKVQETGVYKLTFEYLTNELNIAAEDLSTGKFQIYGNGGSTLAESLMLDRIDDLQEISVLKTDGGDGIFNSGDYVLFYGEGPDVWRFNEELHQMDYLKNIYDNANFYFIKVGDNNGKELTTLSSISDPQHSSDSYNYHIRYEQDLVNLLADFSSTHGSGQKWFGEEFTNSREMDFSNSFKLTNLTNTDSLRIRAEFAGRASIESNYQLNVNNEIFSKKIGKVSTAKIESTYAKVGIIDETIDNPSSINLLTINYPELGGYGSEGWLDYIQIDCKRNLSYDGSLLHFHDFTSINYSSSGFEISDANSNLEIWDISDKSNCARINYTIQNDQLSFGYNTDGLRQFIAFDKNGSFLTPVDYKKIDNQNVHQISEADYIIIYHTNFEEQVLRLKEHRESHSNFNSYAISVEKIYNEFSSGRVDPTAIRNFSKMLYDRDENFKYLLLFGDGSYDYKHLDKNKADQSFIPVYETKESLYPIGAFPTDDYFALLSDQEGDDLKGELDIGVGRMPVRSLEEAKTAVDKILKYETDPSTLGDWRARISFVADDEDSNTHVNQANSISGDVAGKHKVYNQEKIYFDAFQQESTPGGERYPAANKAISDNVYKGLLTLCYLGHGGPNGWSQERVLKVSDINSWDNKDKMPLVVTATCSFAGYDDPSITSAGEVAFLKKEGGAIALFTTVRAVYSLDNKRLTQAVFDTIFTKVGGNYMELGEIMRRAKNSNWQDTTRVNARKFSLIGDPGIKLSIPKHKVYTSAINGISVSQSLDTLKALDKVTVEGYIGNSDGSILSNFNGFVYPTLFDKQIIAQTLGNDSGSQVKDFSVQNQILFKGKASVVNGNFSFSFYIPKDINYKFGHGKFSYYATDGSMEDAFGYFDGLVIGGTSEEGITDDQGPEIDLFMNDENFVFGGITDSDPILLAKISDDFGINISGTSIGHDLTAMLDGDSQQQFILNSFYESELDDYTRGVVRFPLSNIEPGLHTLTVKAWDIANNSNESYLEFLVTDQADKSLEHVLNYPNPFSNQTCFQFEHNLSGTELDVLIYIYSVSGQLVKTIQHQSYYDGFRVNDIKWDGRDDYGSKLANGVYLYKIKVKASQFNVHKESAFEKLVILK